MNEKQKRKVMKKTKVQHKLTLEELTYNQVRILRNAIYNYRTSYRVNDKDWKDTMYLYFSCKKFCKWVESEKEKYDVR